MWALRGRRLAGLGLLLASLAVLIWSLWPLPMQMSYIDLPPEAWTPAVGEPPSATPQIAPGLGANRLTLEWPGYMRVGEVAQVHLGLAAGSGQGPPPGAGRLLTARLELPGMEYVPTGEASQALHADRAVVFRWSLQAVQPGAYKGTVWLYLDDTSGSASQPRRVLSAQRLQIRAGDFLGLNSGWAQALGIAGSVIGVVFGLDGIVIWFWRRFIIQ